MKLKSCEFCGTEYNSELSKCPLCGKSEVAEEMPEEEMPVMPRRGAKAAKKKAPKDKNSDRIPQWMWIVMCSLLGVAVLVGLLYFLVSMGYVGKQASVPPAPEQPVIAAPEQQPEPELPEEPEVVVPEEPDLSCAALSLSQTGIIMDEAGGHVFLTAVPSPLDCPEEIVFTSEDPTVATVDSSGMITAVAPGQTDIHVTCGSVTEICTIVCDFEVEPSVEPEDPEETQEPEEPEEDPEPAAPVLSSEDFTLFRPGEETTLFVKNAPDGANISYVSSDSSVATVTANGLVTAVGSGTCTITVTVNDQKLTCVARCNLGDTTENSGDATTEVSGTLSLYNPFGSNSDVMLFRAGETFHLSLVDSSKTAVSGVSWSTSNGAVCTVDADGTVSAVAKGTATVTASYNGQSYSCIVRCNF